MTPPTPYIIGISGFRRSGKDTLARAIAAVAQARGMATAIIAFADPLRQAAAAAYGIDAAEFTNDLLKDSVVEAWGITRRQMLINLGEAMRGIDPDHWVKAWRRAVIQVRWQVGGDRLWNSPSILDYPKLRLIIAPDLRFIRETNVIHSLGGLNVLLRRDGVTWDGHINEALAQVAQHRDDALAVQIGAWYQASNAMSIADSTSRRIFDCDVDNPVSRRQVEPATEQQRRQLDSMAAAILDCAMQGKH